MPQPDDIANPRGDFTPSDLAHGTDTPKGGVSGGADDTAHALHKLGVHGALPPHSRRSDLGMVVPSAGLLGVLIAPLWAGASTVSVLIGICALWLALIVGALAISMVYRR